MTRFIRSMLLAAMTVTLGAGAANAAPRNEAPKSEPRGHGDRDWRDDHDHDHVRAVRVWRGERWVTIYEPVVVEVPIAAPAPMTAWDFEQRATAERSEANRLRGEARWDRTFLMLVPADNADRQARFLDERAAADDAEARALSGAQPTVEVYER
jgi:hypothetical protein